MMKRVNFFRILGNAHLWSLMLLAVIMITTSVSQADLVHYWAFDEGSGTTALDSGSNPMAGTLMVGEGGSEIVNTSAVWSSDVPTTATHSAGSLQFDNSLVEWVDVGVLGMLCDNQSASLHGTTVSMWVKPDALHQCQYYDWTGIGGSSLNTSGNGNVGGPQTKSDGSIAIMGRDDDGTGYQWTTEFAPIGSITSGTWNHVAVTYVGDKAFVYVNGQISNTVALYTPFTFDSTAEFGIGCKRNVRVSPQQQAFDGLMDDVAIWDVALTPAAIAQLAAGADPTSIVERTARPEYSQIINIDVKRIKDDNTQLPSYTGKGAIEAAGTVWNEAVVDLGSAVGDRDCIQTDAVDDLGNATSVDVSFVDFYNCKIDLATGPYGTPAHPLTDDRMWARETFAPENWSISDLDVGATYDIYFLGATELTIALDSGATPTSATLACDFGEARMKVVDDQPEDWVEGLHYAVLTVTPTSSTISGTILPDEDNAWRGEICAIQIAKLAPTGIPGDTNDDDIVNETDAAMVASHWGQTIAGGATVGDFNSDGVVDAADASIMAANWGDHTESETNGVPEPSALVLLIGLPLMLLARRQRR